MSTVNWMTQIGRLNYFAGQLASRHHVAAEQACDTVRQLANILESMVYNGDHLPSASTTASFRWGSAPDFASLPVRPCTDEGADVTGSNPYSQYELLLPQPTAIVSPSARHASTASYPSYARQNKYRFNEPYTIYSPPPDEVARNKFSTDHVIVLRDLSTPSRASADHRKRRINPCLPVRFRDFVVPKYTFSGDAFCFDEPYTLEAPPTETVDCNIYSADQVLVPRDASIPSHASTDHRARHINPCLPVAFSHCKPWEFTTATTETASDLRTSALPPLQSRYALRSRG